MPARNTPVPLPWMMYTCFKRLSAAPSRNMSTARMASSSVMPRTSHSVSTARGAKDAALAEGRLLLTLEDPAQEPALLRRWQSEQAAAQFPARLAVLYPLAAAEGVACPQLRVRRMTSRWGSCAAATGWVTLSTALLSLPPVCLDYVILHELAHFLHPDHSPAFYAVLDRWMPGHREVRRRMRDFQPRALLLGESIVP